MITTKTESDIIRFLENNAVIRIVQRTTKLRRRRAKTANLDGAGDVGATVLINTVCNFGEEVRGGESFR
jgi:hypothetical protein